MAHTNSSIVLLALLLIATISMGNSTIIVLSGSTQTPVVQVSVSGQLVCSLPPPPSGSPVIVDVTVSLVCSGSTLSQDATDSNGDFLINFTSPTQVTFDPTKCNGVATTPIASCSAFSQPGTIHASLGSVQFVTQDIGVVAQFSVGYFNY